MLAGCGDDGIGTTHPVSGQVTVGEASFVAKSATVMLKPNVKKGNTT